MYSSGIGNIVSNNDDHSFYDHTLNDAEMVELGISQQLVCDDVYKPCSPSINKANRKQPFIRGYVLIDNERG